MHMIKDEITVRMERRKIAVRLPNGAERLGIFHKWTEFDGKDFALVEAVDGAMDYVPVNQIRFLPVENKITMKELETVYRQHGLLKG